MAQGYFGICGNGTTNTSESAWIPIIWTLNYYGIMRSFVEPLLAGDAGPILLNQKWFFQFSP